jgi:hypothetical protein
MADTGNPWFIPFAEPSDLVRDWPALSSAVGTAVAAGLTNASVVKQVVVATLEGTLSGSFTGGDPDNITRGVEVFTTSFTPTSATSRLLVQTSTVSVAETSNTADDFWLALWNGTTFVAANSGNVPASSWAGSNDAAFLTLNHVYVAGSTDARTISVRVGANETHSLRVNASELGYTGANARIQMTVTELSA